ncbi:MAG: hypothetical protein B7Y99_13425 [Caulobacterales bacterium 32-69-10]|nr:MAG: hypothetical protein B7Y99_13425 [Caulobacterales bacterium 32-69-10]
MPIPLACFGSPSTLGGGGLDRLKDRGMTLTAKKVDPETAALYRAAALMSKSALIDGRELQEVYEAFFRGLTGPGLPQHMNQLARWALVRIGAYELADRLCDFATFGDWALGSEFPIFLQQLARVSMPEDRLALLEQHRRWATRLEQKADRTVISPPAARKAGKLRVGLISTGFDQIVGRFCLPLFEHRDPSVELYAYAVGSDGAGVLTARLGPQSIFRQFVGVSALDAAKAIAEDDLDMLIELDGLSGAHALDIMAYRPARRQASWLGYPHSTGLSAIDHIIVDPQLQTTLLLERPLTMPGSWIALPQSLFNDSQAIAAGTPEQRNGYLTFGTLNNPYKFTPKSLQTWARILKTSTSAWTPSRSPAARRPANRCGWACR